MKTSFIYVMYCIALYSSIEGSQSLWHPKIPTFPEYATTEEISLHGADPRMYNNMHSSYCLPDYIYDQSIMYPSTQNTYDRYTDIHPPDQIYITQEQTRSCSYPYYPEPGDDYTNLPDDSINNFLNDLFEESAKPVAQDSPPCAPFSTTLLNPQPLNYPKYKAVSQMPAGVKKIRPPRKRRSFVPSNPSTVSCSAFVSSDTDASLDTVDKKSSLLHAAMMHIAHNKDLSIQQQKKKIHTLETDLINAKKVLEIQISEKTKPSSHFNLLKTFSKKDYLPLMESYNAEHPQSPTSVEDIEKICKQ